jgi:hypothetical protein
MMRTISMFGGVLAAMAVLTGCTKELTYAEQYPGPWQPATGEVAVTLAKNHAQGCGEFYQKPHVSSQGEFLVACTRDGQTWMGYMVWPATGRILGPDPVIVFQAGGPPKNAG